MTTGDLIPSGRSRSSLARTANRNPLAALQEGINRLFDDFWRGSDGFGLGSLPSLPSSPRVEVGETEREVKVEAELPGMDVEDIEILLHDGVLTLPGEKRRETEDGSSRVCERYYGRFERQITLPPEVDEAKVNASFSTGVLSVMLPKTPEGAKGVKRIKIDTK